MSVTLRSLREGELVEFVFSGRRWTELLDLAIGQGWDPAGTLFNAGLADAYADAVGAQGEDVIPETLETSWDGNYTSNNYQEVQAHDAAAMGEALARCPEVMATDYCREFVAFCKRGGFTIV